MTAPSWRRTCQLGARRSSSSDSGGGHDLGLLMGSLSRAHEPLVKSRFSCKGRILIFTVRRLTFHSTLPLTFRAILKPKVFGGARDAPWLPYEPGKGWGRSAPQTAPNSRAPQSARKEDRERCGHNHKIELRALQAEIRDGNKEQSKDENPHYCCGRCHQHNPPVEARFRVSPLTSRLR
jgi:hypothetical protein